MSQSQRKVFFFSSSKSFQNPVPQIVVLNVHLPSSNQSRKTNVILMTFKNHLVEHTKHFPHRSRACVYYAENVVWNPAYASSRDSVCARPKLWAVCLYGNFNPPENDNILCKFLRNTIYYHIPPLYTTSWERKMRRAKEEKKAKAGVQQSAPRLRWVAQFFFSTSSALLL